MAGRISGITIEIGGDTTKLQSSLKDVDKSLSTTQSALKDINKLLKLDPTNVSLLTQKQKDLKEAIDLTKTRLEELKNAQSQYGEGTKEYDAIQREIVDTQNNLKSLQSEYTATGSIAGIVLQEVGGKITEVGDKISDIGAKMSVVSGAIAAAGAASVGAWKEVDSGLDNIIYMTGASGEALTEMKGIATDLATTMPVSFEDASKAVGEINTRFGVTGTELEALSSKFLQFARINGTDVQSSVDGVSAAMASYGWDASNAGAALDILNKVGQDTGTSVGDLASMMQTTAPTMRELGLSFADSAVFLGNLDKNGIDASAAMTGLRTALKNATKDGVSMDQALAEMQSSLLNASSETEALAIASELFGNKAGPAMLAAIKDGRISFDELTVSSMGFADSVSSTYAEALSPLDQMQSNMNGLKAVGAELVETAAPAISMAMEGLSEGISKLTAWWGSLDEAQQQNILKIAGVVAAIGPALVIFGKVVSGIGGITTAIGKVLPVIQAVTSAIGGPWTIAIGAAIAAGGFLIAHWDEVKEAAAKVASWISEKWSAMTDKVSEVWNNMKTKASETWESIKSTATEKTEAMKTMLQGKWNNIKSAYESAGGGLKGVAAGIMTGIKEKWTLGFDAINTLTGGKLNGIKEKFSSIMENVKTVVKNAIDKVKSVFNFNWSLPSLKLPHISVTGGVAPFGIGGAGSLPKFNIQWYKRAYDNPVIFQQPTVVSTPAGLKGFGDGSGAEIVMGLNRLQELVGASGDTIVNVYGSQGMNINELADAVQARLVALQRQREAAYA